MTNWLFVGLLIYTHSIAVSLGAMVVGWTDFSMIYDNKRWFWFWMYLLCPLLNSIVLFVIIFEFSKKGIYTLLGLEYE